MTNRIPQDYLQLYYITNEMRTMEKIDSSKLISLANSSNEVEIIVLNSRLEEVNATLSITNISEVSSLVQLSGNKLQRKNNFEKRTVRLRAVSNTGLEVETSMYLTWSQRGYTSLSSFKIYVNPEDEFGSQIQFRVLGYYYISGGGHFYSKMNPTLFDWSVVNSDMTSVGNSQNVTIPTKGRVGLQTVTIPYFEKETVQDGPSHTRTVSRTGRLILPPTADDSNDHYVTVQATYIGNPDKTATIKVPYRFHGLVKVYNDEIILPNDPHYSEAKIAQATELYNPETKKWRSKCNILGVVQTEYTECPYLRYDTSLAEGTELVYNSTNSYKSQYGYDTSWSDTITRFDGGTFRRIRPVESGDLVFIPGYVHYVGSDERAVCYYDGERCPISLDRENLFGIGYPYDEETPNRLWHTALNIMINSNMSRIWTSSSETIGLVQPEQISQITFNTPKLQEAYSSRSINSYGESLTISGNVRPKEGVFNVGKVKISYSSLDNYADRLYNGSVHAIMPSYILHHNQDILFVGKETVYDDAYKIKNISTGRDRYEGCGILDGCQISCEVVNQSGQPAKIYKKSDNSQVGFCSASYYQIGYMKNGTINTSANTILQCLSSGTQFIILKNTSNVQASTDSGITLETNGYVKIPVVACYRSSNGNIFGQGYITIKGTC